MHFAESAWNLEYFLKKGELWRLFVSEILDYKMRAYLNARKSLVSEHLWTVKMLKGPNRSIFVTFFDHSEEKSAGKSLF